MSHPAIAYDGATREELERDRKFLIERIEKCKRAIAAGVDINDHGHPPRWEKYQAEKSLMVVEMALEDLDESGEDYWWGVY